MGKQKKKKKKKYKARSSAGGKFDEMFIFTRNSALPKNSYKLIRNVKVSESFYYSKLQVTQFRVLPTPYFGLAVPYASCARGALYATVLTKELRGKARGKGEPT